MVLSLLLLGNNKTKIPLLLTTNIFYSLNESKWVIIHLS